MRHLSVSYFSWTALGAMLLTWAGVAYFVWTISAEQEASAMKTVDAEQASLQQAAALRLHTLARETNTAREKLDEIAQVDVIEILDAIEAIARDTKIPIKIGQALFAPSAESAAPLHSATFIVEAEGAFSEVTHAAALLESFPLPSAVSELQFERLPGTTAGSKKSSADLWRMIAHLRFLTTADISS